jgi:hypothetical protein
MRFLFFSNLLIFLCVFLNACEQPGTGGVGFNDEGLSDRCINVQAQYKDLADIHKYTIKRTCAFGVNSCHFDEDTPPMHTVGLFWNMINMPCNTGVVIDEGSGPDAFCISSADGGNDGVVIKAGDASQSYLMIRLRHDLRTQRERMPLDVGALSPEELYVLEAWINGLLLGESTPSDLIDYSKTACPL